MIAQGRIRSENLLPAGMGGMERGIENGAIAAGWYAGALASSFDIVQLLVEARIFVFFESQPRAGGLVANDIPVGVGAVPASRRQRIAWHTVIHFDVA
jgi:hypothetical protein